jgi:hypothetical protein
MEKKQSLPKVILKSQLTKTDLPCPTALSASLYLKRRHKTTRLGISIASCWKNEKTRKF